jgi:hypothetical protein
VSGVRLLVTVHDHAQRFIALKTKTPTRLVQLHARGSEICQQARHSTTIGPEYLGQVTKRSLHQAYSRLISETCLMRLAMGAIISIQADQLGVVRQAVQQRSTVATCAKGTIDKQTAPFRLQKVDTLVEQHGNMGGTGRPGH